MKYIKLDGNALTNITELLKRHFSVNERDKISCIECRSLAEKILSSLPTIEVSEDCISREWAINKQREMIDLLAPHKTAAGRGQVYWQIEERKLVAKELEQAPSVVPKRAECEWVVYPLMDEGRVELECPICGDTFIRAVDYKPHFCENCGAKMKG